MATPVTPTTVDASLEQRRVALDERQMVLYERQFEREGEIVKLVVSYAHWTRIIKLALIAIVIIVLLTLLFKTEKFAPYASILSPHIMNSTAGFDFPNQYGDNPDPYRNRYYEHVLASV